MLISVCCHFQQQLNKNVLFFFLSLFRMPHFMKQHKRSPTWTMYFKNHFVSILLLQGTTSFLFSCQHLACTINNYSFIRRTMRTCGRDTKVLWDSDPYGHHCPLSHQDDPPPAQLLGETGGSSIQTGQLL